MAEAVVSAVINKAVEIGANLLLEESSRLYWLREDVEWLKRQMILMQGYLENAEVKKVTEPNVANLIRSMRYLVQDVEDLLDTYLPHEIRSQSCLKRTSTCFLPYGWCSSTLSRNIEKIKRRVAGIEEDRSVYGIVDTSGASEVSITDPRTIRLHVDDPLIVGFEQNIKELKRNLEKHHFVSVVGMPGLGKTTLAKKVFKDLKCDFDCCASISVSQQPNIANLVQDIVNQVGLPKMDGNMEMNLYSFLQGKRYMVFLDDIWDHRAWDALKGCFPIDPGSSSRIIITSRDNAVGRYIGGENSLHQLHPFDYPTSWELFTKLMTEVPSPELETIGQLIVKKCGGVPLAIVVVVGVLRRRGMSKFSWEGVLDSIGENANDQCSQILGLSYRDLPNFLKPCFLYFGNFPEDYLFSESEIIRLWMAEKFIQRVGGGREPEDVGADYLAMLESRNLIQVIKWKLDGRVSKFQLHDLLYHFCVSMGKEIDFLNTVDHLDPNSANRVRRLAGHGRNVGGKEETIYEMTKLRALFHVKFDGETQMKHLNNMLGRFTLLQTLILNLSADMDTDVSLPHQIESLSRLTYLHIETSGSLTSVSRTFQNLKNLQTLYLKGYSILHVAARIWSMEQLRHLVIKYIYIDSDRTSDAQVIKICLPNLQTLVGVEGRSLKSGWWVELANLRKLKMANVTREIMEDLCGEEPMLKKLESLSCSGCPSYMTCHWNMTRRLKLTKYDRLMKLEIHKVQFGIQVQQPLELPPSLMVIKLYDTCLNEDPMQMLKHLPQLKILRLGWDSYRGKTLDCSGADSFPRLEILEIHGLIYLRELIEGDGMGMPKLRLFTNRCRVMLISKRLQQLQFFRI